MQVFKDLDEVLEFVRRKRLEGKKETEKKVKKKAKTKPEEKAKKSESRKAKKEGKKKRRCSEEVERKVREVLKLINKGYSGMKACEMVGLSYSTFYNYMRRKGESIKSYSSGYRILKTTLEDYVEYLHVVRYKIFKEKYGVTRANRVLEFLRVTGLTAPKYIPTYVRREMAKIVSEFLEKYKDAYAFRLHELNGLIARLKELSDKYRASSKYYLEVVEVEIREWLERGMSVREIAKKLGVKTHRLRKWLRRKGLIGKDRAYRIFKREHVLTFVDYVTGRLKFGQLGRNHYKIYQIFKALEVKGKTALTKERAEILSQLLKKKLEEVNRDYLTIEDLKEVAEEFKNSK